MSILIKGMEMPKAGELLCIDILPDGKVYIHLDLESKQIATAVPVPPHGRLIDADAFFPLYLKLCLLGESGNDLQDRYVHQLIDDLARAFVWKDGEE